MWVELERRVEPLEEAVVDLEGGDVRVQRNGDLLQCHAHALDLQVVVVAVALHQGTKAATDRQKSPEQKAFDHHFGLHFVRFKFEF